VKGGSWQISSGGGFHPVWAAGGAALFYVAADGRLLRVPITTRGGFTAGAAAVAVSPPFYASNIPRSYDVTRDGKRLLIIENLPGQTSSDAINVVLNWGAELKRLLPN
jgi:serine/threonine-protein kinase